MMRTHMELRGSIESAALAHWIRRRVNLIAGCRHAQECSVVLIPVEHDGSNRFELLVRWTEADREYLGRGQSPDPFMAVRDAFDDLEINMAPHPTRVPEPIH